MFYNSTLFHKPTFNTLTEDKRNVSNSKENQVLLPFYEFHFLNLLSASISIKQRSNILNTV